MYRKAFCLAAGIVLAALLAAAPQAETMSIDWTKYHNHAEVTTLLQGFAAAHPELCRLSSIGRSFQGKEIWCLEITNRETGPGETKPGVYIDGNTHAGEVSGGETCLYIVDYLLKSYGEDPGVTRLVDTRVFYILPKINPDGSDAYLRRPGDPVDPGLIKVDDDGDGLQDEDPAEDLNGDGLITLMRKWDETGGWKTSTDDPRLMVPRRIDEKGEWRILGPEGLDNDGDGRLNEDPPGRSSTVSNRNYPAYWAPKWIQSGSGDYPLSEPEARAQVDFILAHPNIALVQAFHTHSGVILRPYCNLSDDHIPPGDMRRFRAIGALGTEIMGYPVLSVYNDFTTDKANPRHGVFVDWAYDHFGAFALTTEIWKAPGETGKSVFEGQNQKIAMEWNDRELDGAGFVNWKKIDHPKFGEVEIGGWNSNYFNQNPPPKFTEAEWRKNCLFELKRAELTAELRIAEVKAEVLGDRLFKVTAVIENAGYLPTNITEKAIRNRLAKPVMVRLILESAELLFGDAGIEIGHIPGDEPPGRSRFGSRGNLMPRNLKRVEWLVRAKGAGASVEVRALSQKAGRDVRRVGLK